MTVTTNATNPEAADADSGTTGSEPEGKTVSIDVVQADLAEAIKRRDSFAKKYRETDAELKALKEQQNGKNRDDAEKTGDVAKLRTEYQRDLEAKDLIISQKDAHLKKVIIENKFRSIASGIFLDSAIDDVWFLTKEGFDLEADEEGNLLPVVKGKPVSFEQHIKKLAEDKPYLAKNPKKAGAGAHGPGSESTSEFEKSIPTMAELSAMPDGGISWLKNNQKLAAKVKIA